MKLDGSGNILWQKSLGGSSDDRAYSIQQTTDGGYIIAGWSPSNDGEISGHHGDYDYWVVKLGPASSSTSVFGFTLINAATEQDLQPLDEGDVLDVAGLPLTGLNIRANTDPSSVDSVVLVLSGVESRQQTERILPYALFGDSRFPTGAWGNYHPWTPEGGSYTLTATPYLNGQGGTSLTIHFEVVYSATVTTFTLVNATTDQAIRELKDGAVLDLATLPAGTTLNIRAHTDPFRVRSVVFELTGAQTYQWRENGSPYMLFGDQSGDIFGRTLPAGEYKLTATPYSGLGGSGAKGTPLTIHFKVIYSAAVTTFTLVDATTGKDIQQLKEGEVLDLSTLPTTGFNVRANTNPATVGSVVFELKGQQTHSQTENLLPYALFGDDTRGGYTSWTPKVGSYTLTATPYSAAKGDGAKGVPLTIQFTIVNTQQPCTTLGFAPVVLYSTRDGNQYSIITKDFNDDGKLDLAAVNLVNTFSIRLGDGNGSFGMANSFKAGDLPNSLASADFNNDGKIDMAVANEKSDNVSILLGNGKGGFGPANNFAAGHAPFAIASGDFNNDSKLDLVVANWESHAVTILLGTGSGSFGPPTIFDVQSDPSGLTLGDFNNDGNLDVVVTNQFSHFISVLVGKGNGSFRAPANFAAGTRPFSLISNDFNGDGNLDVVVTNQFSRSVSVLLGKGNGSFGAASSFEVGSLPYTITSHDFNNDGKADLAVGNYGSDNVSVLLGNGKGGFGAATNFSARGDAPINIGLRSIASGDFNGDGKPDLAVANYSSIGVLLNNCDVLAFPYAAKTMQKLSLANPNKKQALLYVAPNPFSSQTTVRFSVEKTGYASLSVYNATGVEVRRLYQGQAEGGQEYRKVFESKGLPAGVYLVQLRTGRQTTSCKVVLQR